MSSRSLPCQRQRRNKEHGESGDGKRRGEQGGREMTCVIPKSPGRLGEQGQSRAHGRERTPQCEGHGAAEGWRALRVRSPAAEEHGYHSGTRGGAHPQRGGGTGGPG